MVALTAQLISPKLINQAVACIFQFTHNVGDDLEHFVGLLPYGGFSIGDLS